MREAGTYPDTVHALHDRYPTLLEEAKFLIHQPDKTKVVSSRPLRRFHPLLRDWIKEAPLSETSFPNSSSFSPRRARLCLTRSAAGLPP